MSSSEMLPLSGAEPRRVNYLAHVLVMSVGFFGLFLAFNTAQALQTSLNENLGNWSLATLYAAFTVSSLFAAKVVHMLGPKLSMLVGALPYVAMVVSNVHPGYYWSIPINALVGAGAALLWTGEGVYVARCALQQALQDGTDEGASTSYFNGVFFTFFQFNGTVGLLLASLILTFAGSNAKDVLFIVLAAVAGVGVLVLTTVKNVHVPSAAPRGSDRLPLTDKMGQEMDAESGSRGSVEDDEAAAAAAAAAAVEAPDVSFLETLALLSSPRLLLLVPVIIYNGLSLGFLFGDYTAHRLSFALGSSSTGFVMAAFYFSNSVASYAWGLVAGSWFGRRGLFVLATLCHLAFYFFFLLFNFKEHVPGTHASVTTYALLIAGAVVFALGDAVFESQVPAILQTYFTEDRRRNAAMSNLKMWQSLGFAAQFVLGLLLKNMFWVKLVYLLGLLVVSAAAVLILDVFIAPMDQRAWDELDEGDE